MNEERERERGGLRFKMREFVEVESASGIKSRGQTLEGGRGRKYQREETD